MFQSRSGHTLPTHFMIWWDDSFETYSSRFRWWNLLGCILCPRRGTNPPGVQIRCRRGSIRVPTNIHSSIETRAHLLEQFQAHSDGGFFKSGFPAGSGYCISLESLTFADLSLHASDMLSSYDHGYFFCFSIAFQYKSRRSYWHIDSIFPVGYCISMLEPLLFMILSRWHSIVLHALFYDC